MGVAARAGLDGGEPVSKTREGRDSPLPKHGAFYIGAVVGTLALIVCLFVLPKYAVAVGANALFVCYLGHPYPRAVEIAQVYDFDRAVGIVSAMATGSRNHALAG